MTEHKQSILIVDDNPTNIQILNEILSPSYTIFFATNGLDALGIADKEKPDLILLDIMMPEMDGYEVCRRLKENPQVREIPVIFVTAMAEVEDETKGLELGAVDYITKPVSAPIVKARVKNHLELKQQRDFLGNMSTIDGLTGIANRRRFDGLLQQEWARASRHKTVLSLLLVDIDYFKQFNDHYGHLAGDDCLKQVAQKLAVNLLRPADAVCRYGGEEFACILPNTDYVGAKTFAERLCKSIAGVQIQHSFSKVERVVTVSIGVASVVLPGTSKPSDLINSADTALYEAKRTGRNKVAAKELTE